MPNRDLLRRSFLKSLASSAVALGLSPFNQAKRASNAPAVVVRRWKYAIFVGLLALTACDRNDFSIEEETTERPNIVIFMADDLGWGDSGFNGSSLAKTPNLDEMANAGTVFSRFYSAAPVCSPTRGSVLTGRHPFRYGVYYANVGHLPARENTLAEILRDAGYRTGFFGKWHLGTLSNTTPDGNRGGQMEHDEEYSPPWLHGFDRVFATEAKTPTYDPMVKPKTGYPSHWWDVVADRDNAVEFGTAYWDESAERVTENLDGDDTRVIVDRAIPFMQKAVADGQPFLAVIWTHTPHTPVVASESDRAVIETDDSYAANYFGAVHAMDKQLGRVRETLRDFGVADNTLLWFTSDNGPEHRYEGAPGSSGGLRDAKRSLYEGGIRVPGIVEWPKRIGAGATLSIPAVSSDILPTVLDFTEVAYADQGPLDGMSLVDWLDGLTSRHRGQAIGFESAYQMALISDRFKLIHQPQGFHEQGGTDPNISGAQETVPDGRSLGQNPDAMPSFELYDLKNDPQETEDVSQAHPELVESMVAELQTWRASVAKDIALDIQVRE